MWIKESTSAAAAADDHFGEVLGLQEVEEIPRANSNGDLFPEINYAPNQKDCASLTSATMFLYHILDIYFDLSQMFPQLIYSA